MEDLLLQLMNPKQLHLHQLIHFLSSNFLLQVRFDNKLEQIDKTRPAPISLNLPYQFSFMNLHELIEIDGESTDPSTVECTENTPLGVTISRVVFGNDLENFSQVMWVPKSMENAAFRRSMDNADYTNTSIEILRIQLAEDNANQEQPRKNISLYLYCKNFTDEEQTGDIQGNTISSNQLNTTSQDNLNSVSANQGFIELDLKNWYVKQGFDKDYPTVIRQSIYKKKVIINIKKKERRQRQ
ncbi:UNKNOWN [Stylonychia lemnae]|uniref:Uncharacterized protein n=1 Tax=Stylonychia lemnae TaxID=5949 RepID=A0A078AZX7_STYLE|nr:UNKNOWN [Stylonychia lemnae]|eukprot:CDW86737.1 UNKNOWN [Stylonychia lemnae]